MVTGYLGTELTTVTGNQQSHPSTSLDLHNSTKHNGWNYFKDPAGDPPILEDSQLLAVLGDGRCLYCAVSRWLYGCEDSHTLLFLLTVLEIAEH